MKQPVHEFSRPLQVDRVPNLGSHDRISADEKELVALAKRLGVQNLFSVNAFLKSAPWRGGGLKITGTIEAELEQLSVISLEPFRTKLKFEIERFFLAPRETTPENDEEADVIEQGIVDLGEITAESLALEIDPYPRKPGEVFAGPNDETDAAPEKVSPFTALSKLKPPSEA
jgi:uncharacterized metal-binding protein YceD (DUF177 family)